MIARAHWRETAFSIGTHCWWLLLFLQPFNRFIAIKLLLLLLTALAIAIGRAPPGLERPRLSGTAVAGMLLVAWALLTSLLGPYPLDSLTALRKEMLYQIVLFAGALRFVGNGRDALHAVGAAVAGFGAMTLVSATDVLGQWSATGMGWRLERSHDMVWGGYAANAGMFMPLLVGWLVLQGRSMAARVAGWMLVAMALALVILYGSRTPLLVIPIAVLLLLGLAHKWKAMAIAGIFCVIGAGLLASVVPNGLERYRTLLDASTYTSDARNHLWAGVAEVIAERPLQGYGYGWKKLAWVIRDGGHADRWQAEQRTLVKLFPPELLTAYGKANPHNYPLQVAFELGFLGLSLALIFWFLVVRMAVQGRGSGDRDAEIFFTLALTGLAAYALSNITNGHWVGGLANTAVALAGCIAALRMRSAPGRVQ